MGNQEVGRFGKCGTWSVGTVWYGWTAGKPAYEYFFFFSMELSRPVVVQHHCHFTLTLVFQGQIFKTLYLWNGGPIDMEQKGCESIRCYPHFVTFNVPLAHDLDLGFSRSNFEKVVSGMGWPIDRELKGCESIECWTHVVPFNVHITHDLDLVKLTVSNLLANEWAILTLI